MYFKIRQESDEVIWISWFKLGSSHLVLWY